MAFTLIIGPMKSGKSLELIARVAPYEYAGQHVVYAQPKANTRDTGISSRLGINTEAVCINSLVEVTKPFDVIGIDEVHMFDISDAAVVEDWLEQGKTLFISGLDLDYKGDMYPVIRRLLELKPDTIISKTAVCDVCKHYNAQFSQIVHGIEPVLSGLPTVIPEDGTYEYQARCRKCFVRDATTTEAA